MTPSDIERAMLRAKRAVQWAQCVTAAERYFPAREDKLAVALYAARQAFDLKLGDLARLAKLTRASVDDMTQTAAAFPAGAGKALLRDRIVSEVRG